MIKPEEDKFYWIKPVPIPPNKLEDLKLDVGQFVGSGMFVTGSDMLQYPDQYTIIAECIPPEE